MQLTLACVTLARAQTANEIIFVDHDVTNLTQDGKSWCTAFHTLQDAIAAADQIGLGPVEIRVAEGLYHPTEANGPREATFMVRDGLSIIGGFAGCGEPDPDAQDVDQFPTVISGDLLDNDHLGPENTSDNSYRVLTVSKGAASVLLGSLIIEGGYDDRKEFPEGSGAGLFNDGGSPAIQDCKFRRNRATYGGAVANLNGADARFERCQFSDNHADLFGGAMLNFVDTNILIDDCTFNRNVATEGVAIFTQRDSAITLTDSLFQDNAVIAKDNAATFSCVGNVQVEASNCLFNKNQASGAVFANDFFGGAVTAHLRNCVFSDNTARGLFHTSLTGFLFLNDCKFIGNGGGGLSDDALRSEIVGCRFERNGGPELDARGAGLVFTGETTTVANCRFIGNKTSVEGGGIYARGKQITLFNCILSGNIANSGGGAYGAQSTFWRITNSTFAGNMASRDSGGMFQQDSLGKIVVANSILWGNEVGGVQNEAAQIDAQHITPRIYFSCIQGLTSATVGTGNIGSDPRFVNSAGVDGVVGTADDDLQLLADSPCIDAAANTAVPPDRLDADGDSDFVEPIPLDISGAPRFVDLATVLDVGIGSPRIVDMGAFEANSDCNGNGIPDDQDIKKETAEDCDGNGVLDHCEFSTDCNTNGIPDCTDIFNGTSTDCNENGRPDECEADCNKNGIHDSCDIESKTSADCNFDGIPDDCLSGLTDCNRNGIVDTCEVNQGLATDANRSGVPDECEPPVLFVDRDAIGWGSGLSWEDAFTDLQQALDRARAAGGLIEEIRVAEGIYPPAPSGLFRDSTFELVDGVQIRGGFTPGGESPDERDPQRYPTVLSGDLNNDDTGGFADFSRFENSHHVVTARNLAVGASLDGIVIANGHADGAHDLKENIGGGLYVLNTPLILTNCVIRDCGSESGAGGLFHDDIDGEADLTLVDCVLTHNTARSLDSVPRGGAMCTNGATLQRCVFSENLATSPFERCTAGALAVTNSSLLECVFRENAAITGSDLSDAGALIGSNNVLEDCIFDSNGFANGAHTTCGGAARLSNSTLERCIFRKNQATQDGGAIDSHFGFLSLTDCRFDGNSAREGSAISGDETDLLIDRCQFWNNAFTGEDFVLGGAVSISEGSLLMRSSLMSGNGGDVKEGIGGAIYSGESDIDLINNTIVNNAAPAAGGIFFEIGTANLTNNIIWGNVAGTGSLEDAQFTRNSGSSDLQFNNIEGWSGKLEGNANFGLAPLFVNRNNGNWRLTLQSPCVDAGNAAVSDHDLDLDGHARTLCESVDIGAFEFGIGDHDCDGDRDLIDFGFFQWCFGVVDPDRFLSCHAMDFNGDSLINLDDYGQFAIDDNTPASP